MNNKKISAAVDKTEILLNQLLLANSLEQAGETEEAKKLYEEIIAQDNPEGTYGISAQKALRKLLENTQESAIAVEVVPEEAKKVTTPVKGPRKIPLRMILVVPFVLEIVAAVGLTGFLSFNNGQKAVNDLALELRNEITSRIEQQLNNYIEITNLPNQLNSDAIGMGILNIQNVEGVEKYLGRQLRTFNNLGYISFADERGEYVAYIRMNEEEYTIQRAGAETGGTFNSYKVDSQGNRAELEIEGESYDPRVRPWYQGAVRAGEPTWNEIFIGSVTKSLFLDAGQPVYKGEKVVGVLNTGFILSQVSEFLRGLKIGETGQTFIIERSGLMVASSTGEREFVETNDERKRVRVSESKNVLTSETAEYLRREFKNFSNINGREDKEFKLETGEKQFLQVRPFQDGRGLDWLIVVVIPEADFMAQINANTRNTILLSFVALVVAIVLGIVTSYLISKPILQLNKASKAIASGELDQKVEVKSIDELASLGSSFNQMAQQLKESFEVLEDRVKERTVQLEEAKIAAEKAKSALQQGVVNLLLEIEGAQRGDLTVRAEVTEGAVGSIADAFNSTVRSLRNLVLQVQGVANQVNELADGSAPLMQQVSSDAVTQASEINYTLMKVGEIGQSIQKVADSAKEGASIAEVGAKTAQEGQEVMDQTVQSIENIRTAVEATGKKVDQLTESFAQIQEILTTISGISERTNLVAYNASIEASRAGEQGEGFRVVAEEVRRLAGRVTDATKQIEKIVEVIQKETVEVRSAMETGKAEVLSGTKLVDKTKEILQGLAEISKKIDIAMESISKNTGSQADASQEVNEMMKKVATITQESSSKAQGVTNSLEDLVTVAKTLQKYVSRFRLEKKS